MEFEINRMYNENCLDTMVRMPDNFIDLTVTSPPYDNLRTYNDNIDETWGERTWSLIIEDLYRVTKDGGVVVWVVGDATIDGSETGTSFKQALFFKEVGFNLHDTMIWRRRTIPQNSNRYEPSFEYMFVLSKNKPKVFNPIKTKAKYHDKRKHKSFQRDINGEHLKADFIRNDMVTIENIWDLPNRGNDKIAHEHPAIYPAKLAYQHIISWSSEGDLIYDPFMGSGTTAKAAISANRQWIGSEISKEYCDIIEKRLRPLTHNLFSQQ